MYRVDFINKYIKKNHYKTILCVGVGYGKWFRYIKVRRIFVIDIYKTIPWIYRREDFIGKIKRKIFKCFTIVYQGVPIDFYKQYETALQKCPPDLIFIDGVHNPKVVIDIVNKALDLISMKGAILLNNILPQTELQKKSFNNFYEFLQEQPIDFDGVWCGETYKVLDILKQEQKDLDIEIFNVSNGIAVIKKTIKK